MAHISAGSAARDCDWDPERRRGPGPARLAQTLTPYSERVVGAPNSRPAPLVVAAVLLGIEALAAIALGAVAVTQIQMSRASLGFGVALLMLGFGLLLVLVARGVYRGRRWSRGPAAATQLILLPIAWSFRSSPTTAVAFALAAAAIGIIVGLLHPRSTEVFVGPLPPKPTPQD